jgi:hypothetical protein
MLFATKAAQMPAGVKHSSVSERLDPSHSSNVIVNVGYLHYSDAYLLTLYCIEQ